jgi:putative MATE family efflux protein
MFISLSLMSAISLVDIFLAGILGSGAQAALGIADQIVFLNMLVMTGFCAGVNALLSRSYGAGDFVEARAYMKYSLFASAMVGILATAVGFCAADAIAAAFAVDPFVRQQAAMYIRLCALGNLPWALVMCQGAILRASGQARLCVAQWFIITVLCIGLELMAFFLLKSCRSLAPLAVSWDFAICVGYFVGAGSLRKLLPDHPPFSLRQLVSHGSSIFAVGLPVVIGDICWLISNLLLFSLLSLLPHPTTAQAAWTMQLKIEEAIAYVPLMACCQATAALVGNRIGAADPHGARQTTVRVARTAVLAMFIVGCVTALLAPYAVQYASSDEEVRQLSQQLLIGSIVTFPLNALALVLASALEGAGATMLPMVVNIVGLVLIRLPVAWMFALPVGLGLAGAWIAKCLSNLVVAGGMVLVCKRSDWLAIKVISKDVVSRDHSGHAHANSFLVDF